MCSPGSFCSPDPPIQNSQFGDADAKKRAEWELMPSWDSSNTRHLHSEQRQKQKAWAVSGDTTRWVLGGALESRASLPHPRSLPRLCPHQPHELLTRIIFWHLLLLTHLVHTSTSWFDQFIPKSLPVIILTSPAPHPTQY